MSSMIIYSANTEDEFLSTLTTELSREDATYVVSCCKGGASPIIFNRETEPFVILDPVIEPMCGTIHIRDTFFNLSYNLNYGDGLTVFKSGNRRVITLYRGGSRIVVNRKAVHTDDFVTECNQFRKMLEIRVIPGRLTNSEIIHIISTAVKNAFLKWDSRGLNVLRPAYDSVSKRNVWRTNLYEDVKFDPELHITPCEKFKIFIVYRIVSMMELHQDDAMIYPVYEFSIRPISGDAESAVNVKIDLKPTLHDKRTFSMRYIELSAHHKSTTLTNVPLEQIAELFKDAIPN